MLIKLLDDVALNLSGPFELRVLPNIRPTNAKGGPSACVGGLEDWPEFRLTYRLNRDSDYSEYNLYKGSHVACRSLLKAILKAMDNHQRIFRVLVWQEEFAGVPK